MKKSFLAYLFDCFSEEYKACKKQCKELSEQGTVVHDIKSVTQSVYSTDSYTQTSVLDIFETRTEPAVCHMSTIVTTTGKIMVVFRGGVTKDMKAYEIPVYWPKKVGRKPLQFEPELLGEEHEVR